MNKYDKHLVKLSIFCAFYFRFTVKILLQQNFFLEETGIMVEIVTPNASKQTPLFLIVDHILNIILLYIYIHSYTQLISYTLNYFQLNPRFKNDYGPILKLQYMWMNSILGMIVCKLIKQMLGVDSGATDWRGLIQNHKN